MKKAVAFLIFCLMVPIMAEAQDLASLEQMRQAAERGNTDAQLEMGILYEFGYNMPKNDVYALAWYMHAADQGSELAIKRRDLLKTRMKPEQVDAAQKLASGLISQMPPGTPTPSTADKKPEAAAPAPAEPAAQTPSAPAAEAPAAPATDAPAAAGEQAEPKPVTPPAGGEAEKPASDSAAEKPSPAP